MVENNEERHPTLEHLDKMEAALSRVVDPAVKEYLQLLKRKNDDELRFMCQSLNTTRRHLAQRIADLDSTLKR